MKVLISHYRLVEVMGRLIPIRECSRKVGEVFTDSYGTQYQVQSNQSVKRILLRREVNHGLLPKEERACKG